MVLLILSHPADIPSPAVHKLTMSEVYDEKTGKPNPEVLKKHFVQEGLLEEDVALRIISDGEREKGRIDASGVS